MQGQGFAAPPPGYHPHPPPRQHHKAQTISEFDQPGGFQPGGNPYAGVELGPTTEQVFVSGPPLGKLAKQGSVSEILGVIRHETFLQALHK